MADSKELQESKNQRVEPIASSEELSALRAKLAEAERRAQEWEEKAKQKIVAEAGVRINKDEVAFVGDNGGWLFEVGPQAKNTGLESAKVRCCDETEAIRWFCRTRDYPVGSGKPVDPMTRALGRIIAKCIDPKRQLLINHKLRLSVIRQKLAVGATLSKEDEKLLSAHEAEILGFQMIEEPAKD